HRRSLGRSAIGRAAKRNEMLAHSLQNPVRRRWRSSDRQNYLRVAHALLLAISSTGAHMQPFQRTAMRVGRPLRATMNWLSVRSSVMAVQYASTASWGVVPIAPTQDMRCPVLISIDCRTYQAPGSRIFSAHGSRLFSALNFCSQSKGSVFSRLMVM